MLYLDLALDGAVRASVEASLSLVKAASGSEDQGKQAAQLIDLVTMCLESVCLTSGSNVEMVMILKDYKVALSCPDAKPSCSLAVQLNSCRLLPAGTRINSYISDSMVSSPL